MHDEPPNGPHRWVSPDDSPPPDTPHATGRRAWWLLGALTALAAVAAAFFLLGRNSSEPDSRPQASPSSSAATRGSPPITGSLTLTTSAAPTTATQTPTPGPTFPGKQPTDVAAAAGEPLTLSGISIVAAPIEGVRRAERDLRQFICSRVNIQNATTEAKPFSYTDWKLQLPSQELEAAIFTGSQDDLGAGELGAGQRVTGRVCFNDNSGRVCIFSCLPGGTYVLFLERVGEKQRLGWVSDILGAPTLTAPPPREGYPASVTGTCDEQGTCYGVQQRSEPKNDAPRLISDVLEEGTAVRITCQIKGELRTETDHAPSDLWYRLTNGAYINSIYITDPGTAIPKCA